MRNIEAIGLIENWLDSVGERGYQLAFISALFRSGYTIVHNTSHNSLELGKDVIAMSPEGEWFAFQLKGNPGGRFTISQWQSHTLQLVQLCRMPIRDIVRGRIVRRFIPVLVTNGEIEEDVQSALELFNKEPSNRASEAAPLRMWNRGKLLELFAEESELIWPHRTQSQVAFLRGVVRDFREEADIREFQRIIDELLGLELKSISKNNALSRIISAYFATALYTSSYVDNLNLFESIRVKIFLYVRILAYADNIGITNRRFDRTIEIIRHSIVSELHSFSLIVCDKFEERSLFNEDFLAEFPVYHVRRLLVQAMCAISLMEVGDETDNRVRSRALEDVNYPCFSHEAVVPAFLAVFWAKEQFRSDRRNEIELISLLGTIVSATKSGESYSPYHSYDDILKHRFKDFLGINFDELDLENPKNYSHFALPVYYMVARRNWKRTSKMYWPDITDIVNNNFLCNDAAGFSAFRSDDGHNYSYFAKYPSTWEGMISNIPRSLTSPVPKKAQLDIPVFILYLIFFPFRANVDILLYIDRQVTRAWY